MSSPHFYQAEQRFVEAVFGMKPNKQQHQTAIDINPVGTRAASHTLSLHPSCSSLELVGMFRLPPGDAVFQRSTPELPGAVTKDKL